MHLSVVFAALVCMHVLSCATNTKAFACGW
jgi:hypothetical protein